MRVLIYEPASGGHRLTVVRVMLESLRGIVDEVTVASHAAAPSTEEFRQQLGNLADRFRFQPLELTPGRYPSVIAEVKASAMELERLVRSCSFDHVYVPWADGLVQLLGTRAWLHRWPTNVVAEGLLMRSGFANPGRKRWRNRVDAMLYRWSPFHRIHLNDPRPFEYVCKNYPQLRGRVSLLPDPIDLPSAPSREEARQKIGLPVEGRLLGVIGLIDERKGCDQLIRAFLRAGLTIEDRLLLAGGHTSSIRKLLSQEASHLVHVGRIISIDRYLSEEELTAAAAAMDLMVATYPNFYGPASIIVRAAAAGRPVLASDHGWMGYVVPRFDLGRVCDPTNEQSLREAIESFLPEAQTWAPTSNTKRLLAFYSLANVQARFTRLIRERLGLPQLAGRVEWPTGDELAGHNT